jgi:DNA-binding NtrC family response regulator
MNKRIHSVSPGVMELLMRHDFPGNIRELENAIEHAFVLCNGSRIQLEHLPKELLENAREPARPSPIPPEPLKRAEAQVILRALKNHGGSRKESAEELGISGVTLWRKMKKLGIQRATEFSGPSRPRFVDEE